MSCFLYSQVTLNARMTEEIRRIFEVHLVFADNVGEFSKR